MTSSQIIQTQILWEVCTDEPGFPFDPDGLLSENKQEILERLHRLRRTRPDAYLAKHIVTRCGPEDEYVEGLLH